MTYAKYLVDNFNGSSIDTTVWTINGSSHMAESGGFWKITTDTSYPFIDTKKTHDLSQNIWAVKWNAGSGTATSSVRFIVSAHDSANNEIRISAHPIDNTWDLSSGGSATVSGTLTGTGLGTALANGTWWGLGMLGSDNIIRVYTSTDGKTFTQFGSATVGGTFAKTAVTCRLQCGYFTGTESPTWASNIDEAAVFQTPSQKAKTHFGGAWVESSVKVRIGGAWVRATPKLRNGHTWTSSK